LSCPECDMIKDDLYRSQLDVLSLLGVVSACVETMRGVTYQYKGDANRVKAILDKIVEDEGHRLELD